MSTAPLPLAAEARSLNNAAHPLVEALLADASALHIDCRRNDRGVHIVDAGIAVPGSLQAGLRIADICMAGQGRARLSQRGGDWPLWVEVCSESPVLACLASQYAGWSLAASPQEGGGRKFFALGSGPARALARKEPLFDELGYRDPAARGVLVLEVDHAPPPFVIDKLLRDCGLAPSALTLILTPTTSPAGSAQVVSRVLEVALHRAHQLGFALGDITAGWGRAPLPATSPDGVQAMGRTNDAILYGGRVHLQVRGSDEAARALAQALPSCNSRDHGRPFAELFKDAGFDFYQLDGALFAPAEVWVSSRESGRTWHAGATDLPLLMRQWLSEAA